MKEKSITAAISIDKAERTKRKYKCLSVTKDWSSAEGRGLNNLELN